MPSEAEGHDTLRRYGYSLLMLRRMRDAGQVRQVVATCCRCIERQGFISLHVTPEMPAGFRYAARYATR